MENKFKVNDTDKDVSTELDALVGKDLDKLSSSEAKQLTLIMAQMLGIATSTGKVKKPK